MSRSTTEITKGQIAELFEQEKSGRINSYALQELLDFAPLITAQRIKRLATEQVRELAEVHWPPIGAAIYARLYQSTRDPVDIVRAGGRAAEPIPDNMFLDPRSATHDGPIAKAEALVAISRATGEVSDLHAAEDAVLALHPVAHTYEEVLNLALDWGSPMAIKAARRTALWPEKDKLQGLIRVFSHTGETEDKEAVERYLSKDAKLHRQGARFAVALIKHGWTDDGESILHAINSHMKAASVAGIIEAELISRDVETKGLDRARENALAIRDEYYRARALLTLIEIGTNQLDIEALQQLLPDIRILKREELQRELAKVLAQRVNVYAAQNAVDARELTVWIAREMAAQGYADKAYALAVSMTIKSYSTPMLLDIIEGITEGFPEA